MRNTVQKILYFLLALLCSYVSMLVLMKMLGHASWYRVSFSNVVIVGIISCIIGTTITGLIYAVPQCLEDMMMRDINEATPKFDEDEKITKQCTGFCFMKFFWSQSIMTGYFYLTDKSFCFASDYVTGAEWVIPLTAITSSSFSNNKLVVSFSDKKKDETWEICVDDGKEWLDAINKAIKKGSKADGNDD